MGFQTLDMSSTSRRHPYGILWGLPSSYKTTALAEAFPDYLVVLTNPGAMDGPRGWLESQGKPFPQNVMVWTPEKGENYLLITRAFFRHLGRLAMKVKPDEKGRYIPPGPQFWDSAKLSKSGIKVPAFFEGWEGLKTKARGVIISEMTSLYTWIIKGAEAKFGTGFGRHSVEAMTMFEFWKDWNAETGLGIIGEGHPAEKIWKAYQEAQGDEEEEARVLMDSRPEAPLGPDFFFKKHRSAAVRWMDFCWELRTRGTGLDQESVLLTGSQDFAHEARRTRARRFDPETPFTTHRNLINLTKEGIGVRDVCIEAGFIDEKMTHTPVPTFLPKSNFTPVFEPSLDTVDEKETPQSTEDLQKEKENN